MTVLANAEPSIVEADERSSANGPAGLGVAKGRRMTHSAVSQWMSRSHASRLLATLILLCPFALRAQVRVDEGKHTRLQRFGRDVAYGTAEGLAFAGVDQARNQPPEWGTGMSGYERRAASNVGGFLIQETVTESLAAALNRPLDYRRCQCSGSSGRFGHALLGAVTDEMPSGAHVLAVPRIVGAYTGAFAQTTWRPLHGTNRVVEALTRGSTSLAIGAAINLYHEFVR